MKCHILRLVTASVLTCITLPSFATSLPKPSFYKMPSEFQVPSDGNWFLSASAGIQRPILDSRYTVNNGSGYAPPYNVDSYSTNINNTAAIALDGGYRWTHDSSWIPAYALGLRYAHSFSEDIGKQVTQYSMSDYTNYNYDWNIYSDIFMLLGKIDLFEWQHLMPYFSAGAGFAFNTAANYQETALAGIIPRETPAYARNSKGQFAYSLGAGIDWQCMANLIISAGYEYQNLGTVSSGNAINSWAGSHLRSGTYQTSSVMLGATWLL